MSSEWIIQTLNDVCLKITDGAHQSPKSVENGKPMCSVKDLTDFGLNIDAARHISNKDFENLVRQGCMPLVGDVLIAKDGNSALDTVCSIDEPVDAVMLSSVAILRPNPEIIDADFLKYYFKSKQTIEYLKSNFISGAAIPRVVLKDFKKAEIRLPNLNQQRTISRTLRLLDDRIQLNRQINQNLEQMAQAIFKSWFVDFEPVKAKIAALESGGSEHDALLATMQTISGKSADQLATMQSQKPEQYAELKSTAELFPSTMQDSQLGEIPKGWDATTFGAVSNCLDKHRIPLSKRQREERQGEIPYFGATSIMDFVDEHIFDGIYLLLGEDGSVLREDGTPFIQYIWGKSWVNNHAHVLQGVEDVSTEQLMLFIGMQNISAYVTGAVQLKLNQKNMNSIPFIKANKSLNEAFNNFVASLFARYRINTEENRSLTIIRDALLPQLLSGELEILDGPKVKANELATA